jgi:hypothetical protein
MVRSLTRSLSRLLELSGQFDRSQDTAGLVPRVTSHLGCGLADLSPVTERFPSWEHINVHRGGFYRGHLP